MSTELVENAPPPFILSQTISVTFSADQLLGLAMDALAERGHILDPKSIKSSITKNGLTINAESTEGKPAPKKRAPRKTAAKAAPKTTTPKAETKVEDVSKATKTKEKSEEPVADTKDFKDEPKKDQGVNPFKPATEVSTNSNEETIAEVKDAAGVATEAPFSVDTAEIVESDTGTAPESTEINPFNFDEVGKDS